MRKRKSEKIKRFALTRIFTVLTFILICIFIGTGYSLLTTKLEITGKSTIISNEVKKEDVTEKSNSIASISYESSLGTTHMFTLLINNQDEDYYNWTISFDISDTPNEVMICNKEDEVSVTTSENTITVKQVKTANWSLNSTNQIQFSVVFNREISPLVISNIIVNGKKIDSFISNSDKIVNGNLKETDMQNANVKSEKKENTKSDL